MHLLTILLSFITKLVCSKIDNYSIYISLYIKYNIIYLYIYRALWSIRCGVVARPCGSRGVVAGAVGGRAGARRGGARVQRAVLHRALAPARGARARLVAGPPAAPHTLPRQIRSVRRAGTELATRISFFNDTLIVYDLSIT